MTRDAMNAVLLRVLGGEKVVVVCRTQEDAKRAFRELWQHMRGAFAYEYAVCSQRMTISCMGGEVAFAATHPGRYGNVARTEVLGE